MISFAPSCAVQLPGLAFPRLVLRGGLGLLGFTLAIRLLARRMSSQDQLAPVGLPRVSRAPSAGGAQ